MAERVDHERERALVASLLHQPARTTAGPPGGDRLLCRLARWAGVSLASVFVAYHGTILLAHNLPNKGLTRGIHRWINDHLAARDWLTATGNTQSWAMFAPNPHRTNMFMRIFVHDASGEVWDIKHDIYGRRKYPYVFYDRMGKINRRIIETKGYRRHYAAWVCREWERTHGGESAEKVRMMKMWTQVPPPHKAYRFMYFDPMDLYLHQVEEDEFRCADVQQGQLPNMIRERLGFERRPDDEIRETPLRTWYDRRVNERRAEERNEETETPQGGAD